MGCIQGQVGRVDLAEKTQLVSETENLCGEIMENYCGTVSRVAYVAELF